MPGHFDQIDVAAPPGVTPGELRDRIRAVAAGRRSTCARAPQQAAKETSDLESNLSFLRTFLLVFAYVALVVGAFIIFNTFSITVAQRTREFGLLRTLGASRRQMMQSVVYEGLLLGVRRRRARPARRARCWPRRSNALFKAFGADLPNNGTVARDAHDRRVAAGRHRRDGARRTAARAARHARAAARGDARGRGDPARTC